MFIVKTFEISEFFIVDLELDRDMAVYDKAL
jgi:hypothetical protein